MPNLVYTIFLKRDRAFSVNLTESQIYSNPYLSNRFRIYKNILNILIENIQNLRETILYEDSLRRTVFTILNDGGYLDTYHINFFNNIINNYNI